LNCVGLRGIVDPTTFLLNTDPSLSSMSSASFTMPFLAQNSSFAALLPTAVAPISLNKQWMAWSARLREMKTSGKIDEATYNTLASMADREDRALAKVMTCYSEVGKETDLKEELERIAQR